MDPQEPKDKPVALTYDDVSEMVKTEPFRNALLYLLLDSWYETNGKMIETKPVSVPTQFKKKRK